MARLVALQQSQLSFPPLASSLSDFHGARLQTHIQVLRSFHSRHINININNIVLCIIK